MRSHSHGRSLCHGGTINHRKLIYKTIVNSLAKTPMDSESELISHNALHSRPYRLSSSFPPAPRRVHGMEINYSLGKVPKLHHPRLAAVPVASSVESGQSRLRQLCICVPMTHKGTPKEKQPSAKESAISAPMLSACCHF